MRIKHIAWGYFYLEEYQHECKHESDQGAQQTL